MAAFPCLIACLALAIALLGAGCEGPSATARHNPFVPVAAGAALLRSGDSLTVSLQGVPDAANLPQQIDERGTVTLPYIGPVQAAGATSSDLAARIRATYVEKKIYNSVDVTVTVTERYVYVGGEVSKQGRIVWSPDLTLSKAVQAAGGFTIYARKSSVRLVRDQRTYSLDVGLAQRYPSDDPPLFPGDAIEVPRSPF